MVGRKERQLDPGPLREFAHDLRVLRAKSGMTYRELARRAGYSASALSAAASGQVLPTLDVLMAYVGGCGAETNDWERRWHALSAAGRTGGAQTATLLGDGLPGAQAACATQVAQLARAAKSAQMTQVAGSAHPAHGALAELMTAEPAATPPAPQGPRTPRRRPARPVHLGLAPIILATAAIVTYTILHSASPGLLIGPQSPGAAPARPPASAPVTALSSPAARPSQAQPATRPATAQEPGTNPATGQPGPGTATGQPGTGTATGQAGTGSAAGQSPAQGPEVRDDFEQPGDQWFVFWGQQVATGGITSSVAYRGSHSYMVTITGATASRGYSAIGIAHGLTGLHPGSQVTIHLRSSRPADTEVRFFAMNSQSAVTWAPENATGNIPLPPGSGWSAMTWTIPAVDQVHAIGIQVYSATEAPLEVAIDDVTW